ncbi:MAG: hypothetical protein WBR29_07620 [Gammaproteobacteria bacterium]
MNSFLIACISAACIYGGVLLGIVIRSRLPEHHLSSDSKDTMKLGAAMMATLSALVLGLLISSTKGTYDMVSSEVTRGAATVIQLDRALAAYGPETRDIRIQIQRSVAAVIADIWPEQKTAVPGMTQFERANSIELVQARLRALAPVNDAQRQLLTQAEQLSDDLLQFRWLLIEQLQNSLPIPLLVMLVFWLTMLHLSFGLQAPRNLTVMAVLLVTVLSVSSAIFIILELNHPLTGMIKVSNAPLLKALEYLGQ